MSFLEFEKNINNFIFYFIDLLHYNKQYSYTQCKDFIIKNPSCLFYTGYHTAYTYAASKSLNTLQLFNDFYNDIKEQLPDVYIEPYELSNEIEYNLLHYVLHNIDKGDSKNILHFILNNLNININSTNNNNETALIYLIKHNKPDLVKLILYYNADINVKYKNKNILYYTIHKNNVNMFEPLISKLSKKNIDSEFKYFEKNSYIQQAKESIKNKLYSTMQSYKKLSKSNKNKKNLYIINHSDYYRYVKSLFLDLVRTEQKKNDFVNEFKKQKDNHNEKHNDSEQDSDSEQDNDNEDNVSEEDKCDSDYIYEDDNEYISEEYESDDDDRFDISDNSKNKRFDIHKFTDNNDEDEEYDENNVNEENEYNYINEYYNKLYHLSKVLGVDFYIDENKLKSIISDKIYLLYKDIPYY